METLTGVIIGLIISIFGPAGSGHESGFGQSDLNGLSPGPPEKNIVVRPVEALGGGFKKDNPYAPSTSG